MKSFLSLALIPLLAVAARGQESAANPGLADLQQSDREFLHQLEHQESPPPIAEGPAPEAPVTASEPTTAPAPAETRPSPTPQPSKRVASSKPKSSESASRKRTSEERNSVRSKRVAPERVYVGIAVDAPAIIAPLERRVRTVVRPIEIRRAIPVIKPFRIFDGRDDDDDDD